MSLPTSPSGGAREEQVRIKLDLGLSGQRVRVELTVPRGPTRPARLLPILQGLTDAVVGAAVTQAARAGDAISCKAGCGACCRQLVPVSETEARRVPALLEALPEPLRARVRARFEAARARLDEAGFTARLLDAEALESEDFERLGLEYFRLGLPCPFLEDESCSIHPDRPLVCREYLVTSPAERCAQPTPDSIRRVELSGEVSEALARLDGTTPGRSAYWVPLALAPTWAATHPDEPAPRPGPELIDALMHLVTGSPLPRKPPPRRAPPRAKRRR